MRTDDLTYGEDYWQTLDDGAGYADSIMWADIAHIIHELFGVDRVAGRDLALSKRVLDVGCAFGFLLRHLRGRGYDVRGVDLSQYALDNAPDDVKFYLSYFDLTSAEVRLADWYRPFDLVTCFETLEHVRAESTELALEHLWSAMKPGGFLLATICVQGHPDAHDDPTHVNVAERSWWDEKFEQVGLVSRSDLEDRLRWFWLFSQHRGVFVLERPNI